MGGVVGAQKHWVRAEGSQVPVRQTLIRVHGVPIWCRISPRLGYLAPSSMVQCPEAHLSPMAGKAEGADGWLSQRDPQPREAYYSANECISGAPGVNGWPNSLFVLFADQVGD